jgi:tetratricopeptide (TPR) repeat protein
VTSPDQWAEVLADCSHPLDEGECDWRLWRARGLAQAALRKWPEAENDFAQASLLKADDWQVWKGLGRAHAEMGNWKEALNDLTRVLAQRDTEWDVWYLRGYGHAQLRQHSQAIADQSRAIQMLPEGWPAWYARGISRNVLRQPDKAVADFTETLRLYPECRNAYTQRGLAYLNRNAPDQALADFDRANRLGVRTWQLYDGRGRAYGAKRQYDQALAAYNEALRLNPRSALVHNNRGVVWTNKGDWDKAIADYSEAIRLNPDSAMYYSNRASAWNGKSDPEKALADCTEAIRLDPKYQTAYTNGGDAHATLEQWDQAFEHFSKRIDLGGQQSAAVWSRAALAKLAAGELAGYRQFCAELFARFGKTTNIPVANYLAWCCALAPEALADLKPLDQLTLDLVTRQPANAAYRNTRGSVLFRMGKYQEAMTELTASVEIQGNGGKTIDWLFLAMTHHRLGAKEEAKKWLDKAVQSIQRTQPKVWRDRVELQLLRREAETLLNGKGNAASP